MFGLNWIEVGVVTGEVIEERSFANGQFPRKITDAPTNRCIIIIAEKGLKLDLRKDFLAFWFYGEMFMTLTRLHRKGFKKFYRPCQSDIRSLQAPYFCKWT